MYQKCEIDKITSRENFFSDPDSARKEVFDQQPVISVRYKKPKASFAMPISN